MQTRLPLEYEQETDVPPEFEDDVRTPEAYVRHFLREYSEEGDVTTLAWDVADIVAGSFHFDGEVVVGWEGDEQENRDGGTYGCGYDYSYCLVFSTGKSG